MNIVEVLPDQLIGEEMVCRTRHPRAIELFKAPDPVAMTHSRNFRRPYAYIYAQMYVCSYLTKERLASRAGQFTRLFSHSVLRGKCYRKTR